MGSSHYAFEVMNLTSIREDEGSIPGLTSWAMDLALLWLGCRPAAAALIQPLAWEFPHAAGAILLKKKRQDFPSWLSG